MNESLNQILSLVSNKTVNIYNLIADRLIVAVVIVLVGFILGKIVQKISYRVFHGFEIDEVVKKGGIKFSIEEILSNILMAIVYVIFFIIALERMGVTSIVLNVVSVFAIVIILVSFLLALKDYLPNAFAGFVIMQKEMYKKGNVIEVNDVKGKVMQISMAETKLETNGDIIFLPNFTILKNKVKVYKKV